MISRSFPNLSSIQYGLVNSKSYAELSKLFLENFNSNAFLNVNLFDIIDPVLGSAFFIMIPAVLMYHFACIFINLNLQFSSAIVCSV